VPLERENEFVRRGVSGFVQYQVKGQQDLWFQPGDFGDQDVNWVREGVGNIPNDCRMGAFPPTGTRGEDDFVVLLHVNRGLTLAESGGEDDIPEVYGRKNFHVRAHKAGFQSHLKWSGTENGDGDHALGQVRIVEGFRQRVENLTGGSIPINFRLPSGIGFEQNSPFLSNLPRRTERSHGLIDEPVGDAGIL